MGRRIRRRMPYRDKARGGWNTWQVRPGLPVVPERALGCTVALGVLCICSAGLIACCEFLLFQDVPSSFVESLCLKIFALLSFATGVVTLVFTWRRTGRWLGRLVLVCRSGVVLAVLIGVVSVLLASGRDHVSVCLSLLGLYVLYSLGVLRFARVVGLR